jgi:hypothetical protein
MSAWIEVQKQGSPQIQKTVSVMLPVVACHGEVWCLHWSSVGTKWQPHMSALATICHTNASPLAPALSMSSHRIFCYHKAHSLWVPHPQTTVGVACQYHSKIHSCTLLKVNLKTMKHQKLSTKIRNTTSFEALTLYTPCCFTWYSPKAQSWISLCCII